MVRSSGVAAHTLGRGFRDGRQRGSHARERHAARASRSRHHSRERGSHGSARPPAPIPDSRAPRGTRARRGGAPRARPAQGRVPCDARTRAAQSACAVADGFAAAEAIGRRPADRRTGQSHDGEAGGSSRSARRRPAGNLADHARHHRRAPRPDRARHTAARCARHDARHDRVGRPRAVREHTERADRDRRRFGAAHAGVREPAHERGQVHQPRRPNRAERAASRRARRGACPRQRDRHPAEAPRLCFRDVHAGRSLESPLPGRARHRAHVGPQPRRDARRPDHGARAKAPARAASSW